MSEMRPDFHELMDRVLAGSDEAAKELVELYGPAVLRVVRLRLHAKLRSKFDSDDFVQDVWTSFFADPPRMNTFDTPEDLALFLTQVARNKVIDASRHRARSREGIEDGFCELSLDDSTSPVNELVAPQASPSTAAMSREEWDSLLERQPLVYRRILQLYRAGRSTTAIADDQKISERTVRRVIARLLPGCLP
jgi:RNA polymerase sigma factor (sigma-70 family)